MLPGKLIKWAFHFWRFVAIYDFFRKLCFAKFINFVLILAKHKKWKWKKKEKKTVKQKLSVIWKNKESKFVFGFEDRNRKAAGV